MDDRARKLALYARSMIPVISDVSPFMASAESSGDSSSKSGENEALHFNLDEVKNAMQSVIDAMGEFIEKTRVKIAIKGDAPASADADMVGEQNDKGWIPFILPMVYCLPEGWLEYWAPRLYKIGIPNKKITDYMPVVYDHRFDSAYLKTNEMVKQYSKWFILETYMDLDTPDQLDSEFLDANSLELQFIQEYLEAKIADNYKSVSATHAELHKDMPDLGEYILMKCKNCILGSDAGNKKYVDEFLNDLKEKKKNASLNPLIILATLATEKNFASTGYKDCMGIGLPGKPNHDMEDPFGDAVQIYLRNYAVGYYFYKLHLFDPSIYYTDPKNIEKRTEKFTELQNSIRDEFVSAGGNWGPRSGGPNNVVGSGNDHSLLYGPRAGVCDYSYETVSGYVADYITGMYSSDKWAQENPTMSLFLEGVPFLPNSAGVYARQKFNPWNYFPSAILDNQGKVILNIGTFNAQQFYSRIKRTKSEYEKWKSGDSSWKN